MTGLVYFCQSISMERRDSAIPKLNAKCKSGGYVLPDYNIIWAFFLQNQDEEFLQHIVISYTNHNTFSRK